MNYRTEININVDLMGYMKTAEQISKDTGNETGFCLYYINENRIDTNRYELCRGHLCVGDSYSVEISFPFEPCSMLMNDVKMFGYFHVHTYSKILDEWIDNGNIDENGAKEIVESCESLPSPLDLKGSIDKMINSDQYDGIMNGASILVLSDVDIRRETSCYFPNHVSINRFIDAANRFNYEGQDGQLDIETIEYDGKKIAFPMPGFKSTYNYMYGLFSEAKFNIDSSSCNIII